MHLFGWNYGTVESWWIGDVLWTGFKCSECNEINSAHPTDYRFRYNSPDNAAQDGLLDKTQQ